MTIRTLSVSLAVLASLGISGCNTPGPLHLYTIAPGASEIHDQALGPDTARAIPSYLQTDQLTGFAYDPYTDHFFLRLAPGNRIRVVDRPARKIKSEFVIAGGPVNGGGDLAVNPRDGHLYLIDPHAPAVIETTRLGKRLRRIPLSNLGAPPAAIAFDSGLDQLLVLGPDGYSVHAYDRDGRPARLLQLKQRVAPSLAFDSVTRRLYAPLAEHPDAVGVFDPRGNLLQTIGVPAGDQFIDIGPHSFLRIF